ncbi:hypothetical protein L1887_25521 [Cichorium endivia]|nr:hypothetical protein L1887_25521 [Cichorium endivia]
MTVDLNPFSDDKLIMILKTRVVFKEVERGRRLGNESNFPPQTQFHSHLKSQSPCQFPADLRQNSWPFVDKEFRTKGQRFVNAQHINNLKTLIKN